MTFDNLVLALVAPTIYFVVMTICCDDPAFRCPLQKGQHPQQHANVQADEHTDAQHEREAPHHGSPAQSG